MTARVNAANLETPVSYYEVEAWDFQFFPPVFHFVVLYIFKVKIAVQNKCQQQIIFDLLKGLAAYRGKRSIQPKCSFFPLLPGYNVVWSPDYTPRSRYYKASLHEIVTSCFRVFPLIIFRNFLLAVNLYTAELR